MRKTAPSVSGPKARAAGVCLGAVSPRLAGALSAAVNISDLDPQTRLDGVPPFFLQEITAGVNDFSQALLAKEQGLAVVAWATAGGESLYPQLVLNHRLFDWVFAADPRLLELCAAGNLFPAQRLHLLPPPIAFEQANPFDQCRDAKGFLSLCALDKGDRQPKPVQLHRQVEDGLSCVCRPCPEGLMAVVTPGQKGFDRLILQAAAEGRNMLVLSSDPQIQGLNELVGVAQSRETALSWAQMAMEASLAAASQRAGALRFVWENFSPFAVWNRLIGILDAVESSDPAVTVLAPCTSRQQVQKVLAMFEAQSWAEKRLCLLTDDPPDCPAGVSVFPSSAWEQPLEQLNLEGEYAAFWLPGHYYGPEYLKDLALAASFGHFEAVCKAQKFQWNGDGVIEQAKIHEYTTKQPVPFQFGLCEIRPFAGRSCRNLLEAGGVHGAVIDGFQLIVDGVDATPQERAAYGAPASAPVVDWSVWEERLLSSPEDGNPACGTITLDLGILTQLEVGDAHSLEDGAVTVSADTKEQVSYVRPKQHPNISFQRAPGYTVCPQIVPGGRYQFCADLDCTGNLHAVLMLVAYDENRQLSQTRIECNGPHSVQFTAPEDAKYYIPLLRLKGKGTVTCRNARLLPLPDMTVALDEFGQAECNSGILAYHCTFQTGQHLYLSPNGYVGRRLSNPPRKNYFPQLRPDRLYEWIAEGWASSREICEVILLFYDDKKQLGRVSIPVGACRTFSLPPGTTSVLPVLRMAGNGQVLIQNVQVRPHQLPLSFTVGAPYYALLTNHYPSRERLYANMFVHTRVKAYQQAGLNVLVFVVKRQPPGSMTWDEFEGVRTLTGAPQDLVPFLKENPPLKALLHFAANIQLDLLAEACPKVPKVVWCHGADSYPAAHRMCSMRNYRQLGRYCMGQISQTDVFQRLVEQEDTMLVPVSQALRADIEQDYGIELDPRRYQVIHNYIDGQRFSYRPKRPEDRLRIVSVKSYSSHIYAGDICAQVVQELAKRPCFSQIEFSFYGQGELFYPSLAGLARFSNVHLHRTFLSPDQLAQLYHENGICLIPTRHDTQGVSRDEAMACGLVPITNKIAAVPEFVDDTCGFLLPPEDAKGMADAIERLVQDPALFLKMSENAARRVREQSGFEQTLQKEIDLILSPVSEEGR